MSDPIYSVLNYGQLIADPVRMNAYDTALRKVCRPGCRVLDIGTGPGMFALLACRYGAARVYAAETSEVISLAREIAAANGVADRITFLQGMTTRMTLPEPVDVVIADVRGVLPMTGHSLVTMIDARRFLAPGGVLIPQRDRLHAALVESEAAIAPSVEPWRLHARGFTFGAAERLSRNVWHKVISVTRASMLTEAGDLFTLDYRTIDDPSCGGSFTTPVTRAGIAHGLVVWFDATILDGIGFSNIPEGDRAIYGQAFFPLADAVPVEAGDVATVGLRATFLDGDYVWSWTVTLETTDGLPKHRSSLSTFYAQPLSPESLRRADPSARLHLNGAGKADRLALDRLDDGQTPSAVAEELARTFPDQFRTVDAALGHVIALTMGRCES